MYVPIRYNICLTSVIKTPRLVYSQCFVVEYQCFDIFSYFSTLYCTRQSTKFSLRQCKNQSYTSNHSKVVSDQIDKDAAGSDHCTFKHSNSCSLILALLEGSLSN